jgi:hypothetical protein
VAGRIGKGAFGAVWQAVLVKSKKEVVLKVVFPDPDLDPADASNNTPTVNQLQSFKREIEILAVIGEVCVGSALLLLSLSRSLRPWTRPPCPSLHPSIPPNTLIRSLSRSFFLSLFLSLLQLFFGR